MLATVEESLKSFMRELVANSTRALNGMTTALATVLLGRRSSRNLRSSRRRQVRAWRRWWRAHDDGKSGTFNALLARDGFVAPSGPSTRQASRSARVDSGSHRNGISVENVSAWQRLCNLGSEKKQDWLRSWSAKDRPAPTLRVPTFSQSTMARDDSFLSVTGSGSDLFLRPAGITVVEESSHCAVLI